MGRTFYTERDIEDLAKRGINEVEVNERVYITDLAREKMQVLGVKAKAVPAGSPSSSRADVPPPPNGPTPASTGGSLTEDERQRVIEKVKSGVIARLGAGVDAAMLDTIVKRVVGRL